MSILIVWLLNTFKMPRLANFRLTYTGRRIFRRRRKNIRLNFDLIWDQEGDESRNGTQVFVRLMGQDGPLRGRDDLIFNYIHWITQGSTGREELEPRDGPNFVLTYNRIENTTNVEVRYRNEGNRFFNEDIGGRDEIYALLGVFDIGQPVPNFDTLDRTNTVRTFF